MSLRIAGVGDPFAFANYDTSHQLPDDLISTSMLSVRGEDLDWENEVELDLIIGDLVTNHAPHPRSAAGVGYPSLCSRSCFYRKRQS